MLTFDQECPVTIFVRQEVKAQVVDQFEKWLHIIAVDAMTFEGHLGVNVIRPSLGSLEYTVIFRFRTPAQLRAWLDSDMRARRLSEAQPFFVADRHVEELSGLEAWFTLPDRPTAAPPPRYKMALVTFLAVFSLLMVIPRLGAPLLVSLPPVARMLVVSATMITLMTYGVMPVLVRVLHSWLYPGTATRSVRKTTARRWGTGKVCFELEGCAKRGTIRGNCAFSDSVFPLKSRA
jgi:uncharacterized protein